MVGESPYPVSDAVRVVALVLNGGVLSLSLATGYWYLRARRVYKRRGSKWVGAAGRHVLAIAIAHVMLTVGVMVELTIHVREPLTWRPITYAVSAAFAIYALVTILLYEQSRIVALEGEPPLDNAARQ